jgi:hypothetical protein
MVILECPICSYMTVVKDRYDHGKCPLCGKAHYHYVEITQSCCDVKELGGEDLYLTDGGWIFEEIEIK